MLAEAMIRPSGEKERLVTHLSWASQVPTAAPPGSDHRRMEASFPAVARRAPSELMAIVAIRSVWPLRVLSRAPPRRAQMRTVASLEAEMSMESSGEKASACTALS